VIQVLAMAERPLRACEIHAAAQELAGIPLSWNTVKDCLHKNAGRGDSTVERVGHGLYRVAEPSRRVIVRRTVPTRRLPLCRVGLQDVCRGHDA